MLSRPRSLLLGATLLCLSNIAHAASGETLFRSRCAYCHAHANKINLAPDPKDDHDLAGYIAIARQADRIVIKVLGDGHGKGPHARMNGKTSPRDVRKIINFLRTDNDLKVVAPIVGFWQQESEIDCATKQPVKPASIIRELEFTPQGDFYVTWVPFETYKDYWGRYTLDEVKGTLELEMKGGNHTAESFSGHGAFELQEDGSLILQNVYLGTQERPADQANTPKPCGYIFKRSGADPSEESVSKAKK